MENPLENPLVCLWRIEVLYSARIYLRTKGGWSSPLWIQRHPKSHKVCHTRKRIQLINNDFVAHCKEHTAFAKSVTPQNLKCACHQTNGFLSITLASKFTRQKTATIDFCNTSTKAKEFHLHFHVKHHHESLVFLCDFCVLVPPFRLLRSWPPP